MAQRTKAGWANAILAVSLAVSGRGRPAACLYRYIAACAPIRAFPDLTVIGVGNFHLAARFQLSLCLNGFQTFPGALEALVATYYTLGDLLLKKLGGTSLIGGGAFAPALNDSREAFGLMVEAIEKAGYSGKISLGIDAVGSDLYHPDGFYHVGSKKMAPEAFAEYYLTLTKDFPLVLIEDPFHEDDFANFAHLTATLPGIQIVGDDLFATNPDRLRKGMERNRR